MLASTISIGARITPMKNSSFVHYTVMRLARDKATTECRESSNTGGGGGGGGAEATESVEGASKPDDIKLFSTLVSVPQPSRSRLTSDGKIQPFSSGRSRSSGSKNSLSGVGSSGWIHAELYLTDIMLCYKIPLGHVCCKECVYVHDHCQLAS